MLLSLQLRKRTGRKHYDRIHRYEYCAEYRKIISNQIVDRLIRFEMDLNSITEIDSRFSKYYKAIVAELIQITDGHLLP